MQVVAPLIPVLYHALIPNHTVLPTGKPIVVPSLAVIQSEQVVILLADVTAEIAGLQYGLCEHEQFV